jgi:hypothetical protein
MKESDMTARTSSALSFLSAAIARNSKRHSCLILTTSLLGFGGLAQAQQAGAPIGVTGPPVTVLTTLQTVTINENNDTETGTASIPLSVTLPAGTYSFQIQSGSATVGNDGESSPASDSLLFQLPAPVNSVTITSDLGPPEGQDIETYTAVSGNFQIRYEILSDANEIPEPSGFALLVIGVAGLCGYRRRQPGLAPTGRFRNAHANLLGQDSSRPMGCFRERLQEGIVAPSRSE